MPGAYIQSTDTLEALYGGLLRFRDEGLSAAIAISSRLNELAQRVEERVRECDQDVVRAEIDLDDARSSLQACHELAQSTEDQSIDCSYETGRVRDAEGALHRAQRRLENARGIAAEFDKRLADYEAIRVRLSYSLDDNVQQSSAFLLSLLHILRRYLFRPLPSETCSREATRKDAIETVDAVLAATDGSHVFDAHVPPNSLARAEREYRGQNHESRARGHTWFFDENVARRVVSYVIQEKKATIDSWLQSSEKQLTLLYHPSGGEVIGEGISDAEAERSFSKNVPFEAVPRSSCTSARIVLARANSDVGWVVKTAYPEVKVQSVMQIVRSAISSLTGQTVVPVPDNERQHTRV